MKNGSLMIAAFVPMALGVLALVALNNCGRAEENPEPVLIPLETSIPRAVFGGRAPLKLENLEQIGKRQEPLLVPRGIENLALGKTVTSSDPTPLHGKLAYVTDGQKAATKESFVELGSSKQWIQIDLREEAEIFGVWLWHLYSSVRAYIDVVVMISSDEDFADGTEVTIYNNDHDNSSGLGPGREKAYIETNRGRIIDAQGTKGRYIRFYSNGNTLDQMNHYIEVEIWGRQSTRSVTNPEG